MPKKFPITPERPKRQLIEAFFKEGVKADWLIFQDLASLYFFKLMRKYHAPIFRTLPLYLISPSWIIINSMALINKTELITGADGFIGSYLTEALLKEGAKVKALSYFNSFNKRR